MKKVNNFFEEVDYEENFNIDNYISDIIKFIGKYNLDKKLIEKIYTDSKKLIIQYTNGKLYTVKYNNELINLNYPHTAGAFSSLIDQIKTSEAFIVTPGIFLRGKITDNLHIFTHEMFHTLSDKTYLPYNENNVNYTKRGFKIKYYNKNDEVINSTYDFNALNEGITELLTRKFTLENGHNPYHFQVILCDIILSVDSSIINAYFSRNDTDVLNFIKKIENNCALTKEDILNMPKDIIYNEKLIYKYLRGFIEYSLSLCENIDIQINKIKQIVKELDSDLDYMLDAGSYSILVDEIINEIKSKQMNN